MEETGENEEKVAIEKQICNVERMIKETEEQQISEATATPEVAVAIEMHICKVPVNRDSNDSPAWHSVF
ncbi:hypothetical protein F3Y22_tig00112289pilonHSYRG00095 [Hibiscus syriacus]|uniref:Uncharacterized protein n=1 Tax=Hibiscus syriacus TaxID=106335 RepID=A0A6A2X1N7_HIBSY|nr:hypothetical protein F3Y22_tig00112289pilonHSYRG00095 [Hibiscus syriacus]